MPLISSNLFYAYLYVVNIFCVKYPLQHTTFYTKINSNQPVISPVLPATPSALLGHTRDTISTWGRVVTRAGFTTAIHGPYHSSSGFYSCVVFWPYSVLLSFSSYRFVCVPLLRQPLPWPILPLPYHTHVAT